MTTKTEQIIDKIAHGYIEDHEEEVISELRRLTAERDAALQLVKDHCDDEEKVRAILKEFDRSDQYASCGSVELAEAARQALDAARSDLHSIIMEVARVWPSETRIETARRYVREAESRPSGPACDTAKEASKA